MKKILIISFVFTVFLSLYFFRADFFVSDNAEGKNNFSDNLNAATLLNSNIENNEAFYPHTKQSYGVGADKQCSLQIKAKAASIKYLNQNKNIFELNADKHWSIASISKLMAAVVAFEQIGGARIIKIDEASVATEGISGEFKENEIFSSLDLIKAMLLVSSNDATTVLAKSIGEETFIRLMNQKAQELKMSDTIFFNPSGLSFLNQSTPNDLVKLAGYIYNNHKEIFDITKQKETAIIELSFQKSRDLVNINQFSGRPDFFGGKTGYLDESGKNLISLFNINNQPVLIIILGAEDAYEETKKMLTCISPTLF